MIVVSGVFQMPVESVEDAKAAMRAMMKETLKEPGCIVYQFTQSIDDPGQFRVYEEWESHAHLDAHAATGHMAVFRAALSALGDIKRDVKKIEAGAVTAL
ncbi:MAG: putative quinol monooxygenase [Pseudomonadota bacterium]